MASVGTQQVGSKAEIMGKMKMYGDKWRQDYPSNMTQTDMFRKWVPKEPVDFTVAYHSIGFEQIFTSDKVCLEMMGSYNSNMLYRDTLGECKIPIFSNDEFTVQHPMGIPGVHLGDKHGSKASHLMIVRHTEDGPVTFNEMLPSTQVETEDLRKRLDMLDTAIQKIKDNALISECGPKVMSRATRGWAKDGEPDQPLGDVATMTIRDYIVAVIVNMPEDIRNGRPGYVLKDALDNDVTLYPVSIRHLIDRLYDGENMKSFKAIQPPSENSQFLSHIHCFLLPDGVVPECMKKTYYDCEVIYANKLEMASESETHDCKLTLTLSNSPRVAEGDDDEVDGGCELTRTLSNAPPFAEVDDEVNDEGCELKRELSVVPTVDSEVEDEDEVNGLTRQSSLAPPVC